MTAEEIFLADYPDFSQIPALRYAFIVIYCVIIVLTVLGNLLVVYTVACQKKMHNSPNYLICNLAVSDILVGAFVAPVKLLELVAPAGLQLLNDKLCTALSFTQTVAIFSTILTLLVISMERFFVIVYPLHARRFSNKSRTKIFIALTWVIAILISAPNLLGSVNVAYTLSSGYGNLHISCCAPEGYAKIHPEFRSAYFLFLFVVVYSIPMVVITFTSCLIVRTLIKTGGLVNRDQDTAAQKQAENRRKVAAMMIIVSIGFAICWSPYFLITLTVEYIYNYFPERQFFFTMLMINMLGFLNSCINPFIYIMNARFREQYKEILRSCCCFICIRAGWIQRFHHWHEQSTVRTTFSQLSSNLSLLRHRRSRGISNAKLVPNNADDIMGHAEERVALTETNYVNGQLGRAFVVQQKDAVRFASQAGDKQEHVDEKERTSVRDEPAVIESNLIVPPKSEENTNL